MKNSSKQIMGFHPNVFFFGVASLLTDVSSEMIFTLLPLFLSNVLGAATAIIGLVGGLSNSFDAVFRILSGWLSDKIDKRKLLIVLGYSLSTVVKPFMLLASSWGVVTSIRLSDRVGKGIRTAPRDAIIANSVLPHQRGKGFGFHRAMDTTGAFLGLVFAAIIIYYVQGGGLKLSLETYRWLVLVGVVPAVLAVLVLLVFVHEKRAERSVSGSSKPSRPRLMAGFSRNFKLYLVIMAIFTLGNSGDFFVILQAQNLGAPLIQVTLMLVLFNATYAIVSFPMGVLSDRLGRRRVIILGWFIYALVYLGFALASNIWQVWLLFAGYGIYYGVAEGVARAFVVDLVSEGQRGTACGLYHGVVSFALLPASLIAGWLWDAISPPAAFYLGAGFAFLATLGMVTIIKE